MELQQVRGLLMEQEKSLRFSRFDANTAWALGKLMAEKVLGRGLALSVALRSATGHTLFQFSADGTARNNQNWMNRKLNAVLLMEKSSLACYVDAKLKGEGVERHGLDPREYVFCGGGFPIRLTGGELVGVALASGLPHLEDHAFLVDCLSEFLEAEAPRLNTGESI